MIKGSVITNNKKTGDFLPFRNSIKIKLPNYVIKEGKNGLLVKTPMCDKKGNIIAGNIQIRCSSTIVKPEIEDEGIYYPSERRALYDASRQYYAEQKQYGMVAKTPAKYAKTKQGIYEKVKVPVQLEEKPISMMKKPELIANILALAPDMKKLQPKKKAELVEILRELKFPKTNNLAQYIPQEIPSFKGNKSDTSVSRRGTEPQFTDTPSVRSKNDFATPSNKSVNSEVSYDAELLDFGERPSYSQREMERLIKDRRLKYSKSTSVVRATPVARGLKVKTQRTVKIPSFDIRNDAQFKQEQKAIETILDATRTPEERKKIEEMKVLHMRQTIAARRIQALVRNKMLKSGNKNETTKGQMLLNATTNVLGWTKTGLGFLAKATYYTGVVGVKATVLAAKGAYVVGSKTLEVADAINASLEANAKALEEQAKAKNNEEVKRLEEERKTLQKEAEDLARALADEAEKKRQADIRQQEREQRRQIAEGAKQASSKAEEMRARLAKLEQRSTPLLAKK